MSSEGDNRVAAEGFDAPAGGKRIQRPRGLTDSELAGVIRWVAHVLLEIERGHRSPAALRRFLAPHVAFDLETEQRRAGMQPVSPRDVRGARFERAGRRRGYGVVVVREPDNTWSALMMTLQRTDMGAWTITEIIRPGKPPTPRPGVEPRRPPCA